MLTLSVNLLNCVMVDGFNSRKWNSKVPNSRKLNSKDLNGQGFRPESSDLVTLIASHGDSSEKSEKVWGGGF